MTPIADDALSQFPKNKKILLHACCGPCLAFPAQQLQAEGRAFVAWFHNPNIHPPVEHQRRRDAFFQIAQKLGVEAAADSVSDPEPWTGWTGAAVDRCLMCYERRLTAAARETARRGLSAFTTTLLISPWQNYDQIASIAQKAALQQDVLFLERDWRPSYRTGQQLAREAAIYRQRYCGCLPSIENSAFKNKIRAELKALLASPESSDNDRK